MNKVLIPSSSRTFYQVILVTLLVVLTGCASATLTLESNPTKAAVFAAPLGAAEMKPLGDTPLILRGGEVAAQYGGPGPYFLEFRKDGYKTKQVIVTDLTLVDLRVVANLPATTGMEDEVKLNSSVDTLFEAQRLARAGRHEDALAQLKALQKDAPQLAAIYELEGSIYFLQKKYRDALDAFTLAQAKNPKNSENARMKTLLQDQLRNATGGAQR